MFSSLHKYLFVFHITCSAYNIVTSYLNSANDHYYWILRHVIYNQFHFPLQLLRSATASLQPATSQNGKNPTYSNTSVRVTSLQRPVGCKTTQEPHGTWTHFLKQSSTYPVLSPDNRDTYHKITNCQLRSTDTSSVESSLTPLCQNCNYTHFPSAYAIQATKATDPS